jgi:hypothetical protein
MSEDKSEEKTKSEEKSEAAGKDKSEDTKYFYPNKWTRVVLVATEEVMGENGMRALLKMGKLDHLIGNFPPNRA